MPEDEIDLPMDHPIRKLWEISDQLRDEDPVELAVAGHQEAIRQLIASFILSYENKDKHTANLTGYVQIHPDVARWIHQAFLRMLGGEQADKAFGLKGSKGGRRPMSESELEADCKLADEVAKLVDECNGKVSKAARVYHAGHKDISISKAEKAYRKWYVKPVHPPNLGKNRKDKSD